MNVTVSPFLIENLPVPSVIIVAPVEDVPSQDQVDAAREKEGTDRKAFSDAEMAYGGQSGKVNTLAEQVENSLIRLWDEMSLSGLSDGNSAPQPLISDAKPVPRELTSAWMVRINEEAAARAREQSRAASAAIAERKQFEQELEKSEVEHKTLTGQHTEIGKKAAAKAQEAVSKKKQCEETAAGLSKDGKNLMDPPVLREEIPSVEAKIRELGEEIRGLEKRHKRKAELDLNLPFVYTPLNGAGAEPFAQVMKDVGYTNWHMVPEQIPPDPS